MQATGAAPNLSKHGDGGWVFGAFGDMQIDPKNKNDFEPTHKM